MSICTGYDARSGHACQRQAIATVVAGCEHEHVGPRDVCEWHAGDIKDGRMVCGNCLNSGRPHRCALRALSPVSTP